MPRQETGGISANRRYGLTAAPGPLELLQEIANTSAIAGAGPDLLADELTALQWLRFVRTLGGLEKDAVDVSRADLVVLRDTRDFVVATLAHNSGLAATHPGISGDVTISADSFGDVHVIGRGRPGRVVRGLVLANVLVAQTTREWGRLKVCGKPTCRGAFYDHSKNSSAVWHDVKTCGNSMNARASRARRAVGGR